MIISKHQILMKTINSEAKVFALCSILLVSLNIPAQRKEVKSHTKNMSKNNFIRVYNQAEKKIAKGNFLFVKDSILGIKKNQNIHEINVLDIGI